MALAASDQLPIIDFNKDAMKPGTETWDLTCEHVQKALEEYGCFEATFNEINDELYSAFFSSLEKMFDLPEDTKSRFTSDEPFYGYDSAKPPNPLFEAMGLTHPLDFQKFQSLTLSLWPQGDATFCETLQSYVSRVQDLERTVRKMIFQSYGLERHFEDESESMRSFVRLMKYQAPMIDETVHGIGSHFDLNFITILQADRVGLQVQSKDGEWIVPTPSASNLIVMMGESFFGWSNGRLRCPPHLVKVSGHKPRYSIGLFSSKKETVEIPSEVIDEKHPLLFKPFDYDTLLRIFAQRLRDKAYTGGDALSTVPLLTSHFAI